MWIKDAKKPLASFRTYFLIQTAYIEMLWMMWKEKPKRWQTIKIATMIAKKAFSNEMPINN